MSNEGLQQEGRNVHLRYPSIDPSLPLRTHRIMGFSFTHFALAQQRRKQAKYRRREATP